MVDFHSTNEDVIHKLKELTLKNIFVDCVFNENEKRSIILSLNYD